MAAAFGLGASPLAILVLPAAHLMRGLVQGDVSLALLGDVALLTAMATPFIVASLFLMRGRLIG